MVDIESNTFVSLVVIAVVVITIFVLLSKKAEKPPSKKDENKKPKTKKEKRKDIKPVAPDFPSKSSEIKQPEKVQPELSTQTDKKKKKKSKSATVAAPEVATPASPAVEEVVEIQQVTATVLDDVKREVKDAPGKKKKGKSGGASKSYAPEPSLPSKAVQEKVVDDDVAFSLLVASVSSSSSFQGSGAVEDWAVVENKSARKPKKAPVPEPVVQAAASVPSSSAAISASTEPEPPKVEIIKTTIPADSKKLGVIIGQKGVTLKSIQDAAKVEISIPKTEREFTGDVLIAISGAAEGVAKATKAINDLCSKGYSTLIAGENFQENSISIPIKSLPEVMGKGGVIIRAIQQQCGVVINVPQSTNRDPSAVKIRLGVAGQKENVHKAKDVIKEIVQYNHSPVTHPGVIHAELDVPSSFYSYIIGPKGSEIRHIQGNFKVSVYIPNAESQVQNVLVVGGKPGVEAAQRYILKIIEQATANKAAAEEIVDQWANKDEKPEEPWMEQYTYKRNGSDENVPISALNGETKAVDAASGAGSAPVTSNGVASAEEFAWRSVAVSPDEVW